MAAQLVQGRGLVLAAVRLARVDCRVATERDTHSSHCTAACRQGSTGIFAGDMHGRRHADGQRDCGPAQGAVEGAEKKRDRKKRSIANLHESRHDNPAEMRSVAQIELTRSNARELEPVPDAIERAAIVERAPVRDPGRPTSPEAERLEPEPDLAAHSKRPRLDRPQPTSQVGERDEVGARIVEMLEELFHDECAGGCDCEECDPEEEGHEDDCDCGGCGPAGSWAFRRGQHVAQLRAARAAGLARWRDAATGMRA